MKQNVHSKEAVNKAFQALLAERKAYQSRIITKEETAQAERNKALVTTVAAYTSDSIVKGSAALQLEFTLSTEQLAEKLQKELTKLEELRAAIEVERENLKEADNTKIAADALHILKKEQERRKEEFETEVADKLKTLEEEINSQRQAWEKAESEYKLQVEERQANMEKQRTKELENYKYQLERTYTIDKDDYDKKKKLLVRHLEETETRKEKDWAKRQKRLEELKDEFEKYKTKVDNFEIELEEEVKKAKEKAIKEANRKAKVASELYAKEVEGKEKIAALQISSLEQTIEKQQVRIEKINAELKEALKQVQELSIKALENSAKQKS